MQGIYTYIPETNHVPKEYITAIGLTLGDSSIHLHTNSRLNTEDGTHNNYKEKIGKFGPCPVFAPRLKSRVEL
jgi:hypothetical protein